MKAPFRKPSPPAAVAFCLALVLSLAAGCAGINHLRDAQTAFNQAAAADMRAGFDKETTVGETTGPDLIGGWVNVRASYGSALVSLSRIDRKEENLLRAEKLWGVKLALEALCHWKLGNYEKALAVAKQAQQTDQLYPRDRALMIALPGLVMIDYSYDLLRPGTLPAPASPARTNLVKKVSGLLIAKDGAVDVIEAARAPSVIEADHPVHAFLLQAQLAAYRNYRKAYELLDQTGVPATDAAHIRAQAQLDDLAKRVNGPQGQKLVTDWADRNLLKHPRVTNPN